MAFHLSLSRPSHASVAKKSWLVLLAAFIIGAFPVHLQAQAVQTNYAPASQFAVVPGDEVSPREAAMGEAFVGVAEDASALLSNPAGLASLGKGQVGLLSRFGWVGSFQETALFAMPMGKWGGLGISASYFSYGSLDGHDAQGNPAPSYGVDATAFHAGWGTPLFDQLSLGLALHGFQQTITGTGYSFFLPSVGLLAGPFGAMRLGLSYEDLGVGSWNGSQLSVLEAGGSCKAVLGPSALLLASLEADFQSDAVDHLKVGLEFTYQSQFFLRGGYQVDSTGNGYGGLSLGAGLALKDFALDYAYLPYSDLGDNHRISLTYFFPGLVRNAAVTSAASSGPGGKGPVDLSAHGAQAPSGNATSGISSAAKGQAGSGIKSGPASTAGSALTSLASGPPPVQGAAGPGASGNGNGGNPSAKDSLNLEFDIPPDYVARGDQFEAKGQHADAILAYLKAVQQDAQNVKAWYSLGKVYFQLNQKDSAVQCFEKALALRPDNAALRDWLQKYKAQQP